jgi:hypothetical protein
MSMAFARQAFQIEKVRERHCAEIGIRRTPSAEIETANLHLPSQFLAARGVEILAHVAGELERPRVTRL